MQDVVVDTNIFLHAQNPGEARFADAQNFIHTLLAAATCLRLDEGFDVDEANNRSLIGGEYLNNLRFGSIGYTVLQRLFERQRVLETSTSLRPEERRRLRRLVHNRRDRTFVIVASNSTERTLISHDLVDFDPATRKQLNKAFDVRVLEAKEASNLIRNG